MTKRKILNIFSAIFGFAIGTLMILSVRKTAHEDRANLNDLSFYKGQLTNFYPDKEFHSSTGTTSKLIAIDIAGLNQKIRVFKVGEDYSDFYKNIHIGDTVSVYYREHSPDFFNSDIYQLDINNKNYLTIDEVKAEHNKAKIPITILGLFIYGISIYCLFRK